ncbi:MAG: nuclear transport factor 2 family protein [Gemmatimonadota bacterium]|nr:MAG: nuclear transport factor 2 family protein [Gemmatimonadota bacterium]
MRRLAVAAVVLGFLAACQPATTEFTEEQRAAVADTVRQLADTFFDDFKALDFDRAMAPYADDLVWAESGVVGANRDSLETAWRGVFALFREVTAGEWTEVHIEVLGPDAAAFTASFDWAGVDTSGAQVGGSGAWTTVWQRTAEGWKIVQGHESYLPAPESM